MTDRTAHNNDALFPLNVLKVGVASPSTPPQRLENQPFFNHFSIQAVCLPAAHHVTSDFLSPVPSCSKSPYDVTTSASHTDVGTHKHLFFRETARLHPKVLRPPPV